MIGDRHVLHPERVRCTRHLLDGMLTVAVHRVAMHEPGNIPGGHEIGGEVARPGRPPLSPLFTPFPRDERQAQKAGGLPPPPAPPNPAPPSPPAPADVHPRHPAPRPP